MNINYKFNFNQDDKAWLISETLNPKSTCLTLWYHAFGSSIGSLRIYSADTNITNRNLLWEISGQQSVDNKDWKKGVVPISNIQDKYVVLIEGTVGKDYNGDISIDDIAFLDYTSSCSLEPTLAIPTTTTKAPTTTQGSVYGLDLD